jgi:hypothetical protein
MPTDRAANTSQAFSVEFNPVIFGLLRTGAVAATVDDVIDTGADEHGCGAQLQQIREYTELRGATKWRSRDKKTVRGTARRGTSDH